MQWSHLQTQKVVNSADDNVDGGRVPCLCPQVVLEVWSQEVGRREDGIVKRMIHYCPGLPPPAMLSSEQV